MNFLSMYGIASIVSIRVVNTTVHIIVAWKKDSREGCMDEKKDWGLMEPNGPRPYSESGRMSWV